MLIEGSSDHNIIFPPFGESNETLELDYFKLEELVDDIVDEEWDPEVDGDDDEDDDEEAERFNPAEVAAVSMEVVDLIDNDDDNDDDSTQNANDTLSPSVATVPVVATSSSVSSSYGRVITANSKYNS